VQWHDVPVADGVYRFRGAIGYPSPVREPNGPFRVDLWLGFY
jgi:hypothetical protein